MLINLKNPFLHHSYRIILILTFTVFIFSCSKDDEEPAHPIVGTWTLVSDVYTNCNDPSNDGTGTYTCDTQNCVKATFTKGGKYTFAVTFFGTPISVEGTYTISSNQITICIGGGCETSTFTIDGSTFTQTYEDEDGCTVTDTYTKN